MDEQVAALKTAEKGAIVSIIAYIFLSTMKIITGYIAHSQALIADGWNNFTDILSSLFVLIGLRLSRRPKDDTHQYGHWKMETIASLITSFIMFAIGFNVLIPAIMRFFHHRLEQPDPIAFVIGLISAIIMFFVYRYNKKLAQKVNSLGLMAAAKDNLSDALTSIGTSVAIIASLFHMPWLDNLTALIIGIIIIHTAWDIFAQSAFALSDGFEQAKLDEYQQFIETISGVEGVRNIRGRQYGANIFIDAIVYMDPTMTVQESHDITEIIEKEVMKKFDIFDVEIHVEPDPKQGGTPHGNGL